MDYSDQQSNHSEKASIGLSVFIFFFALAYLVDSPASLALFPAKFRLSHSSFIGFFVLVSGAWVLLKPSSLLRASVFFLIMLADIVDALPRSPNHVVFEGLIIISFFVSILVLKISKKQITHQNLNEYFTPVLRLEVLILYFWAFIHKFNTGFFNKILSCATVQVFNVNEIIPIVPAEDWFLNINPYLTVIVEGSIPILLLIPYTRAFGIIVGIAFHFILGFKYPGFTVLVFALYAVFIPEVSYAKVGNEIVRYGNRIYSLFSRYSSYFEWKKKGFDKLITQVVLIVAIIELMGFFMRGSTQEYIIRSRAGFYLITCVVVTFLYVFFFLIKTRLSGFSQALSFVPKNKILILLSLFVFLNGLLPYLGVKNVQVMAMFSNLRASGGQTNHYFIPASLQIFGYLSDLVEIKGSSIKGLNKFSGYTSHSPLAGTSIQLPPTYVEYMEQSGEDLQKTFEFKMPFVEFQSIITRLANAGFEDIKIEYARNGKEYYTRNAELEPELTSASIFEVKFLPQRAVPNDERGLCMW